MTCTRRHWTLAALGVLAAVAVMLNTPPAAVQASPRLPAPAAAPAARAGLAPTVVTFTWGGGFANQLGALPVFRRFGMHATFYVPSGLVCQPSADPGCERLPYLTLSDVRQIASAGNEIGGLTVEHVPLTGLPAAEAEREICDDRVNLTSWGFRVTDFAYPFALVNPTLESLARRCGYNSGLGTGQLRGAGLCLQCARAETIPPRNPYVLRTPVEVSSVGTSWTPATFEQIVTGAQHHGGGWIIFTVHDVCPRTCSLGMTVPELNSVLSWLSRQAAHGVSVQTVRQVVGGPVRPAVAGPRPPRVPPPGVANGALTTASASGAPACFQTARYGSNHATFSYHRRGGPDGDGAEVISLTQRNSGTAQLLPTLDLGECAPGVSAGRSYVISAEYKSDQPVAFNVYYRTQLGTWKFWLTSPPFAPSATWTRASWTPPAIPDGASAVSFGLALRSDGTVSTTRYSLVRARGGGGLTVVSVVIGVVVILALIAGLIVARRRHDRTRPGDAAGR